MKRLLRALLPPCCAALASAVIITAVSAVNTDTRYIRGDADGNGRVTVSDVTLIQRCLADLVKLSQADIKAADVNGNGIVDVDDATAIQRWLALYGNEYNIEETVFCQTEPPTVVFSTQGGNDLPFV